MTFNFSPLSSLVSSQQDPQGALAVLPLTPDFGSQEAFLPDVFIIEEDVAARLHLAPFVLMEDMSWYNFSREQPPQAPSPLSSPPSNSNQVVVAFLSPGKYFEMGDGLGGVGDGGFGGEGFGGEGLGEEPDGLHRE